MQSNLPNEPKTPVSDENGGFEHLDEMLDEALAGTFPASDPVALSPRYPNTSSNTRQREPAPVPDIDPENGDRS